MRETDRNVGSLVLFNVASSSWNSRENFKNKKILLAPHESWNV